MLLLIGGRYADGWRTEVDYVDSIRNGRGKATRYTWKMDERLENRVLRGLAMLKTDRETGKRHDKARCDVTLFY